MSQNHKDKYNRLFPHKISTNTFLTIYILNTLKKHNRMYGKEISDYILQRFNGNWKPSHGMLYPILRNLEKKGLIKGYWEDSTDSKRFRRFYEITEKGLQAYDDYVKDIQPQIQESEKIISTLKKDILFT
ncbi:MAG: PadR family transcriptional regulator [Ignavibacterium sp.]|nr:PadR family transcriptional regulator [Ignavibacterium sp.]